jgi:hypothetical protein
MGRYSDFSAKHSQYLDLPYGTQKKVRWVKEGVESVNKFGSPCMVFEVEEDEYGPKKYTITNSSVIKQFDNYQIGDMLNIKRNEKGVKPALVIWKDGEEPAPF